MKSGAIAPLGDVVIRPYDAHKIIKEEYQISEPILHWRTCADRPRCKHIERCNDWQWCYHSCWSLMLKRCARHAIVAGIPAKIAETKRKLGNSMKIAILTTITPASYNHGGLAGICIS